MEDYLRYRNQTALSDLVFHRAMVKAGGTCGGRETTEAALQSLLTEMGYKVGVFDGALNPDTIPAAAEVRERLIVK